MTGPTQINWTLGLCSKIEGKQSAIRLGTHVSASLTEISKDPAYSTPFCCDHRPTKTKRSASGSCFRLAHSWASRFNPGLAFSSSSSTAISDVLTCSLFHAPVSVGSGFGRAPTLSIPHRIGYRAKERFPYLAETPTAPNPF